MQEAQTIESPPAPTRLTANWVPAAIVLGLGLGFAALYGVVIVIAPPEPYLEFLSYYLYQLAPIAALVLSFIPLRRTVGLERLGWLALTILLATWTVGDLTYSYYNLRLDTEPPFPGVTDVFYYVGYVAFLAALGILAFPRKLARDSRWVLDAAVVLVAGASLSWAFVLEPIVNDSGYSPRDAAVALGYPAFDFALATVALLALYASGGRASARTVLIMLSAITLGLADSVYTYVVTTVGYDSTAHPTDVAYIAAYVLLAACFVLPPERAAEEAPRRQSLLGLLPPYVVAGALASTTSIRALDGGVEPSLLMGSLAVVVLVVVRQFLTLNENLSLYRALERESAARRSLLDVVVRSQEEERHRLAFDLHDGPVQALSFLANRIAAARKFAERADAVRVEKILREVEQALSTEVQELRIRMMELRPPALEERGLVEAIRDLAVTTTQESGLKVAVSGTITRRPPAAIESMLYRVTQEAITNVRKHAQASQATVDLTELDGELRLAVEDDGIGFDPPDLSQLAAAGHFGLLGIVERVQMMEGSCSWSRRSEGGSRLEVVVKQQFHVQERRAA
jgi:signal transduction histidine kinase